MKGHRLRFGISLLFTCATVVEIAVAFIIVSFLTAIFEISIYEIPTYTLLCVCGIFVGGITAWFVNKTLLSPIKRLSDAMDEVANGNFEIYLESGNRIREIKNIYEKFNIMIKELRSTEILQSDFVSNVSHEIKTPITSIEGYAMLLQSEATTEEEKQIFLEKILFHTRKLSELVGSILLLSKIENQVIKAPTTRFRLDEQIRQSILLLEPKWMQKEMEFDVDLEDVYYEGNEHLLQYIWNNLLDNAIKFSMTGGCISMRLNKEKDTLVFIIEDEGPGIPKECQKKIFNKFYQTDDSRKQEGNGLGLTLVKKIVDLHEGKIKVENLPQKGCRFTVIFPILN